MSEPELRQSLTPKKQNEDSVYGLFPWHDDSLKQEPVLARAVVFERLRLSLLELGREPPSACQG